MTAPAPLLTQPSLDLLLDVDALALTRRVPGPALVGGTHVIVVASVTAGDGMPAIALPHDAFDVQIVAGIESRRATPLRLPIATIQETAPAIYTISFASGDAMVRGAYVLALFVHDANTGRTGRTLVRVEP